MRALTLPRLVRLANRTGKSAPRHALSRPCAVRCVASGGEKSWGELAREAGEVASAAVKKLVAPVAAMVQRKEQPPAPPVARVVEPAEELSRSLSQALGGGLLARGLGSLFGAGISALGGQMREAMRASSDVHADAVAACGRDDALAAALGGGPLQCSQPLSVSSSSINVNGVQTSITTLEFVCQGPRGRAATVRAVSRGAGSGAATDIQAVLPDGRVLQVGGGGGDGGRGRVSGRSASDYAGGKIIDVDVISRR